MTTASLLTRLFLTSFAAFCLVLAAPQTHAQDKVLRVGTLKLIHGISAYFYEKFVPAGYTVEVIPFESPTAMPPLLALASFCKSGPAPA
jgi:NitT/TauT family transport system substrate-binding protein